MKLFAILIFQEAGMFCTVAPRAAAGKLLGCLGLLLLGSVSQGCAFSPVRRPDTNLYRYGLVGSKAISLPYTQALEACRSAAESIGFQIHSASEAAGIVRTAGRPVQIPELCDCGTWNMQLVAGSAVSTLVVTITPQGDNSSLVSLDNECGTTFTARNLYGMVTRQETYRCASKGTIERDFWAMLDRVVEISGGTAAPATEAAPPSPAFAAPPAPVPTAQIFTLEKFDKVAIGSTLGQVVSVLGTGGMSALPATAGVMNYQWSNADGSNITVALIHGKVIGKDQTGLK